MKGRGGHGGPRRPSNQEDTTDSRKKRQDDGATDFESCLTKIKVTIYSV